MVVSIFAPSISASHIYKKRPKFYNKTARVFCLLHGIHSTEDSAVKLLHGLDSTSPLAVFVDAYSDLLRDYCLDIQYDKGEEAIQERLSFKKISTIWRLLQVLYFSGSQNDERQCYGTKLMEWLNRFDKRAILQYDIQGVFNSPIPSRHVSFWPMVYQLTLRGELESLHRLIHIASERAPDSAEKKILHTVAHTILFFPALTTTGNDTLMKRRKSWKIKASEGLGQLATLEDDRSTLVSYASTVIHIMLGDITTLCQNALSSVEATIAAIYYHNDNKDDKITIVMINKLIQQVDQLRDNKHSNDHDQSEGILTLLKGDIYGTLEQIAQLDWWLLAHLADILDEYMLQHRFDPNGDAGLFDNKPLYINLADGQQKMQVDARSFFVLSYAHTLVRQEGMWETALGYMGTCGETGKAEINKVISKIPLTDDNIILGVIEYCTRCGLLDTRQRIFEKLASQLLEQNSYITAIRYYYLAGNYQQMDQVFKTCLHQYCHDKRELDLTDDLGSWYRTRCTGPYALFYFKYCDIVELYEKDKLDQAVHAAIELLLSTDAPSDLLLVFFSESMSIFEKSTVILPTETVDRLKNRFTELMTSDDKNGLDLLLSRCGHDDGETSRNSDIVASLCEVYKVFLDRMSTPTYL